MSLWKKETDDYLPDWVIWEEEHKTQHQDHKSKKHDSIGISRYTGHSGRRSSATLLASTAVSGVQLLEHGG